MLTVFSLKKSYVTQEIFYINWVITSWNIDTFSWAETCRSGHFSLHSEFQKTEELCIGFEYTLMCMRILDKLIYY